MGRYPVSSSMFLLLVNMFIVFMEFMAEEAAAAVAEAAD